MRQASTNRSPCDGENRPGNATDPATLLKLLRSTQRKLERLAGRLADMCDEVDAAAKLLEDLGGCVPGRSEVFPPVSRRSRSTKEHAVMRAEAEVGAATLQIKRQADGSGEVSVNGRRPFRLPPKLSTLLTVLTTPSQQADDGLMDWRTTGEVATALEEATGDAVSPRAVPKLVYKLRKAFEDAGENAFLIQTNRARGVRVAVRGDHG
jgi:hypothetical protein